MKWSSLAVAQAFCLITTSVFGQTQGETVTRPEDFNFVYKHGYWGKNTLDTFKGTYTKDLVSIVHPTATTKLILSHDEMNQIYQKMCEIDFFSYPDTFVSSVPDSVMPIAVEPYCIYYFKTLCDSQYKEVYWQADLCYKDEKAKKLEALKDFINAIISSKSEYKKLPASEGAYE